MPFEHLKQLQYDVAKAIRSNDSKALSPRISANHIALYHQKILSTLVEQFSTIFPFSADAVGTEDWNRLIADFFKHHTAQTPYFYELGSELLLFVEDHPILKTHPFLYDYLHYEYVACVLLNHEKPASVSPVNLRSSYKLSSSAYLLHYHYPLHQLDHSNLPTIQSDKDYCYCAYLLQDGDIDYLFLNNSAFYILSQFIASHCCSDILASTHTQFGWEEQACRQLIIDWISRGILIVND